MKFLIETIKKVDREGPRSPVRGFVPGPIGKNSCQGTGLRLLAGRPRPAKTPHVRERHMAPCEHGGRVRQAEWQGRPQIPKRPVLDIPECLSRLTYCFAPHGRSPV